MRTPEQEKKYADIKQRVDAATGCVIIAYMECLSFFKEIEYENLTKREKLIAIAMLSFCQAWKLAENEVEAVSKLKEYFEPKFIEEAGE